MRISYVREHGPLVHPLLVIGLVVTVGGALVVLFPGAHGLEQRMLRAEVDQISLAYLRALLAERPDDGTVRLRLSREYLELDRFDEARGVLAPLLDGGGPLARDARLQALRVDAARWRSLPDTAPERARQRGALAATLGELSRSAPPAEAGEELVSLALEIGRTDLAAELALCLADAESERRAYWFAEAGRHLLALGRPAAAAEAYSRAAEEARGPGVGYAERALEILAGVPDPEGGVAIADRLLRRYPGRASLLDRAVALARANGRLSHARGWMRERVALSPEDPAVLDRALELELADGDLAAALALARRSVTLQPTRPDRHERLATVAEWAGAPGLALPEWIWIATRARSGRAEGNALRLARGLRDIPTVARMLALRQARGALTRDELFELTRALEDLGEPDASERLLLTHLSHAPDAEAGWELLAELQARQGRLEAAIATYAEVARRLGPSARVATRQAELLWRLHRPVEALWRMRSARALALPEDDAYWALYGELVWALEEPEALDVYRARWRSGRADPLSIQRLLRLALEAREVELAIEVAREGFRATADPELLMIGAEAAASEARWRAVRELLDMAGKHAEVLAARDRYWSLRALLLEQEERVADARAVYEQGLALFPRAEALRIPLLRLLLRQGEHERLRRYLARWRADAERSSGYWRVYASALGELGQRGEACAFLERLARANPDDPDLLVEYADALGPDEAGRAYLLRVRASWLMAPEATRALAEGGDPRRMLSYVSLLERIEGGRAAAPWVGPLLDRAGGDDAVQLWAIGWYLRQKDFGAARSWMQRRRAAGREVPAWQRLQLAYGEDDRRAMAELVGRPGELSSVDRFWAARHLGRDLDAWRMGRKAARADPAVAARLGGTLEQLDQRLADAVTVTAEQRAIGWLDVGGVELAARTARLRYGVVSLHARHRTLRVAPARQAVRTDPEVEGEVRTALGPEGRRTRLVVGASSRGGHHLVPYGLVSQELAPSRATRLRTELAVNETTEETALLRLNGRRSRVSATLSLDLPDGSFGQLTAGVHQHRTHAFEPLAAGHGAQAEVGHRFRLPWAELRVRGTGAWQFNRQVGVLPERLVSTVATGEAFVPPELASAGLGLSLSRGDPEAPGTSIAYIAEVWAGWLWPLDRPGYLVRLGLGVPLSSRAQFALEVGIHNTFDALPTRSIGLMFRQRFGQE